ncbi:MAG: lipocalin-like domain-containing protein [Vicinamibacterales bacterium]
MKRIFAAAALAVFTIGGATTVGSASDTQTDATIAGQFLGMWRLVSWNQRAADGTNRPGQTDAGYLIYTDVNRMCAVMMDSKRPKWPSGAPATVDDAMARFSGFISYCAAVELHAAEGFILHHVDIERSPNIVSTVRKRWFRFEGPNRLVLRIDPSELGGGATESTLTWERVQK